MIRTDDPAKLYAFFSETLQLPVAWPLATRGRVASGGVGFGNVNVEAISFPDQTSSDTQLVGFGFEPLPLSESLSELSRRGVTYGELRPFISTDADGTKKTLFTNVTLRQFSDADRPANATMHVFLSEYSPAYVNVEQRRVRLGRELEERAGGPLGVSEVKEVVIGTQDLKAAQILWNRLLAPVKASERNLWRIGNGPAVRLVPAKEDRLQGLVISVKSLERAKSFLHEEGLLGSVSEKEVIIDPTKIQGLSIRLVEGK